MSIPLILRVLVVLLITNACARALFMRIETEQVPIDRVMRNLQNRLTADTNNVEVIYQIARVHSMAFSTNLLKISVTKDKKTPVFGFPDEIEIPTKVYWRTNTLEKRIARRHLTNAIVFYERAAKLVLKSKKNEDQWLILPIYLGHAWCLDQAGQRDDAIKAYRKALQLSWHREVEGEYTLKELLAHSWDQIRSKKNPLSRPNRGFIGPGACYSEEIIGYLFKLLDPKKDAKEIAQLKSDLKELQSMGRAVTPILVPLEPALVFDELIDCSARVPFDLDGSGFQRHWNWITPKAAWLVFDKRGNGQITSALQMFGNVTFWIFWRNGYDALASLDDDVDGLLAGDELRHLALWQDRNGNGISESGEVKPVGEFGIIGIKCHGEQSFFNILSNPEGVIFSDGKTRPTYDWNVPMHTPQN